MEFAISQPKMVWLSRNEKQTHRLNSRPQMWPSGLTLAMTLTLNFQGQIWNLQYLSQKWCDCHEMKSKHINWSQDLKCDHHVWPWPWPWPWIFKVKFEICYISTKSGQIATKRKANLSIGASNVTNGFDLGHDLHIWIFKDISQLALRRWPNVGIGRHRRDRQPTSRQRWYSVASVATVCWHSVGARRLAYRSLPMFCVWTSVVRIKCFSNKCCRSTRLSIHQLHI